MKLPFLPLSLRVASVYLLALGFATGAPGQLSTVNDWLYVLQPGTLGAGLPEIGATSFDAVVIDYSSDGGPSGEFTAQEIATLKATGKVVLAYLSIGEAESYRWYWNPIWNDEPAPDPDAPSWLGPFNPSFPDNFKVRYWETGWENLLFGTTSGPSKSSLDRILDQGFDGIYLDIIDAFDFWPATSPPERTRAQARIEMMDLVHDLATYARVTRGFPGFLVFPQNGGDIIRNDGGTLDAAGQAYLAAIDGIGVEDLFYDEFSPQSPASVQFRTGVLDQYRMAGNLVVAVDYVWDASDPGSGANVTRYNDFHTLARGEGYVAYAALRDRGLDEILEVAVGGGFSFPQPKPADGIFADGFESGNTSAWTSTVAGSLEVQRNDETPRRAP